MTMPDSPETIIGGRYLLQRPLSRTSFMAAWQGFDTRLRRKVFVKVLSAEIEPHMVRPQQELWHSLARLSVPGMPAILDLATDEAGTFMVTEWLDARSLLDVEQDIRRVGGDVNRLTHTILEQALETLAALHEGDLVHGDISPGNIMISQFGDRVWLIDPAPVLPAGKLMTTLAWAAPEVRGGEKFGPTSDLFALGRVLEAFAERSLGNPPGVVRQMTALAPEQRPQSAAAARIQMRFEQPDLSDPTLRPAWASGLATPAPPRPEARFAAPTRFVDFAAFPFDRTESEPVGRWEDEAEDVGSTQYAAIAPLEQSEGSTDDDWRNLSRLVNVPIVPQDGAEPTDADFIVMGPSSVAPGGTFPLELWMGPSDQSEALRERAQQRGVLADVGGRSRLSLPSHTIITAHMNLPGFSIPDPIEQIMWDGTIRNTVFLAQPTDALREGDHWGAIKLLAGPVPVGVVSFCVRVERQPSSAPDAPTTLSTQMQRFRTAFASYASPDRAEVFKRVQAIRASCVDVFSDIADLRGGERWEDALMREIAGRDVFYLFWSRAAAKSQWVEREWQQALDTRGIDFICPIPLEDPRLAAPPAPLAQLHFNDWCLAVIHSEQAIGQAGGETADV